MTDYTIYTTPAMTAPDGGQSDLINANSQHPHLIATAATCLALSFIFLASRLFTKAYLLKTLDLEDYALAISTVGFTAFTSVMIKAGECGQGKHQWNVSVADLQRIARFANILEIIYPPTMFAAKFAILLQIKHIFTKHQRNFNYYAVHTLLACNFLVYLALFFAFIFACWPREKIWHPHLYGRCISTNASIIATSAINILSDFTILFLPLLSISRLQLPLKKKIGVSTVFAIGLFACIASILRLYYSVKLSQTHDITWAIAPVGMWSLAEFATVIIVGCFPPLPRLWKFLRGHDKPISGAHMSSQEGRIKGSSQASNNKGDKSHEWYTVCRDTDCMYIPLEEQSITNEDRTMRIGQKEDRIPGMNVSLSPLSLTSIRKTTEIGVVTSN